ncbi:DUF6615 family protein [Streptomyces nojiriensis]|uniref:DUF6615 family protein n=1 Tax=Streptomyces nojiriensis TaxID=66374 RepID=UPI003650C236
MCARPRDEGVAASTSGAASTNRSLCRTLRACATRTFERLSTDHYERDVPGEEAYTQFNLQDLRRGHPDRIVIREFRRAEESRNGADWEWWFHSGGSGFGMRVQAKRAKRGGGYDLEHVVRSTGARQSELLVEDALIAGCIPAYVLYNHRNWVPTSETGRAVDCRHGLGTPTQLGCTIVSALIVRAELRGPRPSPAHVRDRSMPWHRILCDAPGRGQSSLEAAHTAVRDLHERGRDTLRAAVRDQYYAERNHAWYSGSDDIEGWRALHDAPAAANGQGPSHAEEAVLGLPVYRGLDELAQTPLSPLPDRVRAILQGREAEPTDERLAGAMVVDLDTPRGDRA